MNKVIKAEVFVIENRCKGCGVCIEVCQADVLERSSAVNDQGYNFPVVKDAEACLGCGMCEMLCPDFAVYIRVVEPEETLS
ncbi:MAG: 4Fe-4S binding protein [candidate division WOR-3 bacterium]|jgi:2-oxoglutarate ferredoxin oxidoreductase subunit delta